MLEKALEGDASRGARTQLIHLYDLQCKVCIRCFACKTIGGNSYGRCAVQDDLTPVFSEIEQAGAIILSSPIYFGTISGQMKSFMARLLVPYSTYTDPPQSFNELLLLYVPTRPCCRRLQALRKCLMLRNAGHCALNLKGQMVSKLRLPFGTICSS